MKLEVTATTFFNKQIHTGHETKEFIKDEGRENELINLFPEVRYQQIEGFGGAITDSAGYVYSKMSAEDKEKVVNTYYQPENMNYQMARIHMDSCDFSIDPYEAVCDAADSKLESFSLIRGQKYIGPLLDAAQEVFGSPFELMVTPWSPPAFMKTNKERNHGGKLKDEYKGLWADYICRYIIELQNYGYHITRMSLQNEPNATQTWDSCIFTAEEEKEFLRDYMYPALVKNHISNIQIFIWDHNKERIFDRACAIIDEETNHMVAGIAFHWYSGDHFEGLSLVREKFPDKLLIMSEACIEYSKYSTEDSLVNAQKYAHEIIGNLNHGMNAFYDWNIVLDEQGGPNHVGNFCDAPILYDTKQQKLIVRNSLTYIHHFSHYIMPGALRIAYSKYTENLEITACENPDKSIVVIILNRSDKSLPAVLRLKEEYAKMYIEPQSIYTCVIK